MYSATRAPRPSVHKDIDPKGNYCDLIEIKWVNRGDRTDPGRLPALKNRVPGSVGESGRQEIPVSPSATMISSATPIKMRLKPRTLETSVIGRDGMLTR